LVKENGAAIGIGFDGDADRIGVVDEKGRFILGDEIMMIVARDILKEHPGSKIIGDVKCSDRLYIDIEKSGGSPIMWKTGHSLIKNKIKDEKAPFGGELSGHIFFADRNYGFDDAPYAGLRLVEILSKSGKTIDELLEGIPSSFSTPEIRLETTEENKVILVKQLQDHFKKTTGDFEVNTIDGVRVSFENGWALVRSSNTQPVITIRFESTTKDGLEKIQKEMMELVDPLL
jgi:phosphomannomutase/phosphomannomutase/phosphoglucomutase